MLIKWRAVSAGAHMYDIHMMMKDTQWPFKWLLGVDKSQYTVRTGCYKQKITLFCSKIIKTHTCVSVYSCKRTGANLPTSK